MYAFLLFNSQNKTTDRGKPLGKLFWKDNIILGEAEA